MGFGFLNRQDAPERQELRLQPGVLSASVPVWHCGLFMGFGFLNRQDAPVRQELLTGCESIELEIYQKEEESFVGWSVRYQAVFAGFR